MLLACLWSSLCLGSIGCGPFEGRALGSRRTSTCAPSTASLRSQQIKERLQHCRAAAAAATAIITVTVILYWLLLCAFPPTSRRCYRSRTNASHVRLIIRLLILSFFLPGSRAALATTNRNNSDTVAGGRQLAETSHMLASVETSRLKQMHDSAWRSPAERFLPWILGGLPLVTVAGTVSYTHLTLPTKRIV